jgi:hypothetical protein
MYTLVSTFPLHSKHTDGATPAGNSTSAHGVGQARLRKNMADHKTVGSDP